MEYKPEHFLPALQALIAEAKQKIAVIKNSKSSFEDTILALEFSGHEISFVSRLFFNLMSADTNDELQALAPEVGALLSSYENDISLDEGLFEKIKEVYSQSKQLKLNSEQMKLLEEVYFGFTRNGALLSKEDKEKLRAIDQELATLGPKFSENVLKATNKFELVVNNEKDLEGIPASAIAQAKELAHKKGLIDKWVFNLQAPSYIPFVTYCKNRDLRKQMTLAYLSRAYKDEFDNQEVIKKIAILKSKRAKLLGFKTYAEYTLVKRMAETPSKVESFLNELITYAKPIAQKDFKELQDFANKLDKVQELKPWDMAFYIEKLKKQKLNFDQEELRPYFKLENVIDGAFKHASLLYNLDFKEVNDIPKYHADVKTYEVYNRLNQDFVGLFFTDFFPRASKQGGAWMTSYAEQGLYNGKLRRPHISIVCNFTPSTKETPSLLTYNEVQTLFHEFGHALHGLLSDCTYQSLAGTNVYWDFVELPSQIMENWTSEKEGLHLFAKHFQTGALMPEELIEKIKKSSIFMAAYYYLRQLKFATLDMAWYDHKNPEEIKNVEQFENQSTQHVDLVTPEPGTNMSCSFGHIFEGGYSAGYYSYKWAEVLEADAFELFKEMGIFDAKTAESFKKHILSRGGTEHPLELYKKFRGREPDPKALLRRDGLI